MLTNTSSSDYTILRVFYGHLQGILERWDSRLRELGLHRRAFLMLVVIKSHSFSGAPSMRTLTQSTRLHRNRVRDLVATLVRQGLVKRARDQRDRRRAAISLTPTGEEWLTLLIRGDVNDVSRWGAEFGRVVQRVVAGTSNHAEPGRPAAAASFTPASHVRTIHDHSELRHTVASADSVT